MTRSAAALSDLAHDQRLVKPADAYAFCGGLSASTVRRMIAAGTFPRPVVLNRDGRGRPVRVAFVLGELVAHNAAIIRIDREAVARG